jgi:hypothetical protein
MNNGRWVPVEEGLPPHLQSVVCGWRAHTTIGIEEWPAHSYPDSFAIAWYDEEEAEWDTDEGLTGTPDFYQIIEPLPPLPGETE